MHKIFKGFQNVDKGITKKTRGKASEFVGKGTSVKTEMLSPNINLGAEWQLARGIENNVALSRLGTQIKLYIQANPLIGLSTKIDLINAVVGAASVAATGNTVAANIFNYVRDWAEKGYESDRFLLNFTMALDAIITGVITGGASVTWNTNSDEVEGKFEASGKIGVRLEAKLELNAKAVIIKVGKDVGEASKQKGLALEGKGSLKADSGEIALKGTFEITGKSKDGLYLLPKLVVEPCVAKVVLLVSVKLSTKKVTYLDWKPVDENEKREFWEEFDILESLFGEVQPLRILKL